MLTHFHCSVVSVPAKEYIIAVAYLPYIMECDLWKFQLTVVCYQQLPS